jgi:hypothetical protein
MKSRFLIVFLAGFLLFSPFAYAYENLTELEARRPRKSTNTFYSGSVAGKNYVYQPQTVIYTDTTT